MITKHEINVLKANILGGMNDYVLDVIGDDDITEYWLTYGVPDGCDEDELMELASNRQAFMEITRAFNFCVTASEEGE